MDRHFDISSATVRNEFAVLEEIGLIKSPHISAGKIPTQQGYRFFVDEFLHDEKEDLQVRTLFQKYVAEYHLAKEKEIIFDILRLLSRLSGNVAFVNIENDQTAYIGLSNVLRSPEFISHPEKAAQIVEILEGQNRFQSMMNSLDIEKNEIKIFIGEENLLEEISSCAMLVTKFTSPRGMRGTVGILGPMRMRYAFNRALLRNALEMLG